MRLFSAVAVLLGCSLGTASQESPAGKPLVFRGVSVIDGAGAPIQHLSVRVEQIQEWRREIAEGKRPGPRIVAAGPFVDGPRPYWPGSIPAGTGDEAREAVRSVKKRGVDFVKVYSLLPREAFFALAEEAKLQGLSFAGHVPRAVTAAEASRAGQKSMEHLYEVFDVDEKKAPELYADFVKHGTWQVPTLCILEVFPFRAEVIRRTAPLLKYLPASLKKQWGLRAEGWYKSRTEEEMERFRQRFRKQLARVGAMHRAGVPLLAGSDAANPHVFPGFGLHDELELLVKAGLTPMEALQCATRKPAEYLEKLDRLGTVEKGKAADLVLLDADPLENISNTRKIFAVVAAGRLFTKDSIRQLLESVEAAANSK